MIRVVARTKAVVAGVAGAAAMELTAQVLRLAGLPAVDLVSELASVVSIWSHRHRRCSMVG